jgi:hypothetical protein
MLTDKQKHRWLIMETATFLSNYSGTFVECGVKQGTSSRIMATILNRKGYLFDTWSGIPHYSKYDYPDVKRKHKLQKRVVNRHSTYDDCLNHLKKYNVLQLCNMIKGDICKTVPGFVLNNSLHVDMMHIDTDLYKPAKVSLFSFYPFMEKHGIIVFHDYGDKLWPGIKKLVDAFVNDNDCFFLNCRKIIGIKAAIVSKSSLRSYNEYIRDKFERV